MRSFTDGSGVCFDLRIRDAEGFIDAFDHLKEREGKRVDFSSRTVITPDPNLKLD